MMRILHGEETLGNVRDVYREHHIAQQPLYCWRRQFGGMNVAEAKRYAAAYLEQTPGACARRLRGAFAGP
jgi:hypothetical protein